MRGHAVVASSAAYHQRVPPRRSSMLRASLRVLSCPADRMSSVSGVVQVDVLKAEAQRTIAATDRVAEEVPLEVRLHGEPFSVIMRTPGSDVDLAAGFLFTESVVRAASDIEHIERGNEANVVNVTTSRLTVRQMSPT